MAEITVKGKQYKILDDIEYRHIRQFRQASKNYNKSETDPEELLLMTLAEMICPSLFVAIKTVDMSIDGTYMTYKDIKRALVDLRKAFDNYINTELSDVVEYIENKPKNSEEIPLNAG